MTSARCATPMSVHQRIGYPFLLADVCGRAAGHAGQHRSVTALERAARRRSRFPAVQAPSGSAALGMAVARARVRAGLSQPRLAALLGVTVTCVQHWEGAKRTSSRGNLAALELALGVVLRAAAGDDQQRGEAAA